MTTLHQLIHVINEEYNVDIREYSRERPLPWLKAIYSTLAREYTEYEPEQIASQLGLHRTSFFSHIKLIENLNGIDKEVTQMLKNLREKTLHIKEVYEEQKKLDKEKRNSSQIELDKLNYIARELGKKKRLTIQTRLEYVRQMKRSIVILEQIESERLENLY